MKKILSVGVLFLLIALVYFVSAQDGPASNQLNNWFIDLYAEIFGELDSRTRYSMIFWIRKTGHVVLYYFIMLGSFFSLNRILNNKTRSLALAYILSLALAGIDEWRQVALPNRTGSFNDVLIDGIGIVLAMVTILSIPAYRYFRSQRNKKTIL